MCKDAREDKEQDRFYSAAIYLHTVRYSGSCKICTRYRTCIRVMSIRVNRMTLIITTRRRRRKRRGEERRKEEREKEREGYLCIREREAATKGKCKGKACHSHCRPEKERRSPLQVWGKETRDRQVQEGTAGAGQTSFGFWFDRPTRQITCGRIETICLIGAFSPLLPGVIGVSYQHAATSQPQRAPWLAVKRRGTRKIGD